MATAVPSIYINLEDDVSKIVTRLKHQSARQVVLVCPKRCFLFSDSINLRLLKKQADILGKEVSVLTMDEKGQLYAKEAGFDIKFLSKSPNTSSFSDIKKLHSPEKKIESAVITKSDPLNLALVSESVKKPNQSGLISQNKIHTQVKTGHLQTKIFADKISSAKKALNVSNTIEHSGRVISKSVPALALTEAVNVTETFFAPVERPAVFPEEGKSYIAKTVTGLFVVLSVAVLVLVYFVLPKATVVVYPKSEPVTRDMEISLSPSIKSADPVKLTLPGIKIEESINISDKFSSQGKKQVGNKSSGTVKIYNFTKAPLNLKAGTTILSVGGRSYNLTDDISGLKPTVYKNSQTKEVDVSSLAESVGIVAVQGGEDSNLPAGTRVEIANQVFGSRPQFLYAKTDTEITGGTTRYLSVISQDDVNLAKSTLEARGLEQVRQKLAQSGLILADKAFIEDSAQFASDNPTGTQTPSFTASLSAKISGLAFKKEDMATLIFQRINQTLSSNKTLEAKNPDQTDYKAKSFDQANSLVVLNVHFEGQAVYNIDLKNIAPELVGKTQSEVNEILRSKAEIDRVDIILAPAWQTKFPKFASKINVTIGKDVALSE